MKPTTEVLVAIDYLFNVPEMRTLRDWLAKAAQEEMVNAVRAVENSDVMRGRAQLLLELTRIIEDAPAALIRLENRHVTTKDPHGGARRG